MKPTYFEVLIMVNFNETMVRLVLPDNRFTGLNPQNNTISLTTITTKHGKFRRQLLKLAIML